MPPKISLITVARNAVSTIADTMQSVAKQDYPDIEHIVVDGASRDGTIDVVRRHALAATRVISEPDQGVYDAMNKGVRAATGDIVGFLNADDVFADTTILSQVVTALTSSHADACYADLVYVDKDNLGKIVRYWKSRQYEYGLFSSGWMPAHPTFYVRREVYEKFGVFDLEYRYQSDFELTMRLMEVHGVKTVYVPRIWVKMRVGGISNRRIRNIIRGNIEAYRACRRHGKRVSPLFIVRKIFLRLPQFLFRPHPTTTR